MPNRSKVTWQSSVPKLVLPQPHVVDIVKTGRDIRNARVLSRQADIIRRNADFGNPPATVVNDWFGATFVDSVDVPMGAGNSPGNFLTLAVLYCCNTGNVDTPSGWTLISSIAGGLFTVLLPTPAIAAGTLYLFTQEHSPATLTHLNVTCTGATNPVKLEAIITEWSNMPGLGLADATANNSGLGTTMDTGTTAALASPDELVLASFAADASLSGGPTSGYSLVKEITFLRLFFKNTDAIAGEQCSQDASSANAWIAQIDTFERR